MKEGKLNVGNKGVEEAKEAKERKVGKEVRADIDEGAQKQTGGSHTNPYDATITPNNFLSFFLHLLLSLISPNISQPLYFPFLFLSQH